MDANMRTSQGCEFGLVKMLKGRIAQNIHMIAQKLLHVKYMTLVSTSNVKTNEVLTVRRLQRTGYIS
jgi:hypothetical protein